MQRPDETPLDNGRADPALAVPRAEALVAHRRRAIPQDTRSEMSKDKDILSEALEAFRLDVQHEQVNRDEAADDLKFRAGEQWPLQLQQERVSARRPLLTINRMPQFVRQVTGDLRQNRPSIKVRPVDEQADPDIAKTYTGLIRHIEYVRTRRPPTSRQPSTPRHAGWAISAS
jgi:hypothetical protein